MSSRSLLGTEGVPHSTWTGFSRGVGELIEYRERKVAEQARRQAAPAATPPPARGPSISPPATTEFEFDVALSFAGENRAVVQQIADLLAKAGIKIFYDAFEKATLWGKDLYQHLHEVYSKRARFCVIFVSEAYAVKVWTNHELRSAQERALGEKGKEYILPVRFDDTEIPGLPKQIGHLDLRKESVEEVAALTVKKVRG